MVRFFGNLPYPYDIVVQAFFCPVVLNPGRDTKQELSKNWSEDYTTKQLRDRPHLSSNNRAIRRRR